MSDFGRMREYAGEQMDYIAELEEIIATLPPETRSMFPSRPEGLTDPFAIAPVEEPPAEEPPAEEPTF